MANPAVVVEFLANTRDLQKGVKDAERSTKGFGSKLKTLGKTGALAAGAAGVGALVYTLKTGIGEFQRVAEGRRANQRRHQVAPAAPPRSPPKKSPSSPRA